MMHPNLEFPDMAVGPYLIMLRSTLIVAEPSLAMLAIVISFSGSEYYV